MLKKNFSICFLLVCFLIVSFVSCDFGPVEGMLIEKQHYPAYTEVVDDYTYVLVGDISVPILSGSHEVYYEAKYYFVVKSEEGDS